MAAELELGEAQEEFTNIDRSYQEKQKNLNQLLSTPEGLALIDPVKNPLISQRNKQEKHADFSKRIGVWDLEIIINSKELIDAALKHPETQDLYNVAQRIKPKGLNGLQSFGFIAGYFTLAGELQDVHHKIEQTKKELAPVLEARNKAEDKKKIKNRRLSKKKRNSVRVSWIVGTNITLHLKLKILRDWENYERVLQKRQNREAVENELDGLEIKDVKSMNGILSMESWKVIELVTDNILVLLTQKRVIN